MIQLLNLGYLGEISFFARAFLSVPDSKLKYEIGDYRWHATMWLGLMRSSSGAFSLQTGLACGHLGWNRQPLGGLIGLGTSPGRMIFIALAFGSGIGTA